VAADPLVASALLDDEPGVHPAAAEDVLDGLAGPDAAMRHPVAVEYLGDLAERVVGELVPYPANDRRFLWDDDELAGMVEPTSLIAPAGVAQRIVAAVSAVLEQSALESRHPLRVEVTLELGSEAELTEQIAPGGAVEPSARQVGNKERDPSPLEFVQEIEHEPSVSSKP
jgi:hypothetical protein